MAQQISKSKFRQHSVGRQLGRLALALTLALLFNSIICRSQSTTSQVDGTARDSSGAVVIGANIKLSNTATGIVYSTTSENLGMYHLTNLPPGSYAMEVTKEWHL
jgi:hypothetical protein